MRLFFVGTWVPNNDACDAYRVQISQSEKLLLIIVNDKVAHWRIVVALAVVYLHGFHRIIQWSCLYSVGTRVMLMLAGALGPMLNVVDARDAYFHTNLTLKSQVRNNIFYSTRTHHWSYTW